MLRTQIFTFRKRLTECTCNSLIISAVYPHESTPPYGHGGIIFYMYDQVCNNNNNNMQFLYSAFSLHIYLLKLLTITSVNMFWGSQNMHPLQQYSANLKWNH